MVRSVALLAGLQLHLEVQAPVVLVQPLLVRRPRQHLLGFLLGAPLQLEHHLLCQHHLLVDLVLAVQRQLLPQLPHRPLLLRHLDSEILQRHHQYQRRCQRQNWARLPHPLVEDSADLEEPLPLRHLPQQLRQVDSGLVELQPPQVNRLTLRHSGLELRQLLRLHLLQH